jgi:hypothetical protein
MVGKSIFPVTTALKGPRAAAWRDWLVSPIPVERLDGVAILLGTLVHLGLLPAGLASSDARFHL